MARTDSSLMCHRPISSETAVQGLNGSRSCTERKANHNWCPQYCRELFSMKMKCLVEMERFLIGKISKTATKDSFRRHFLD